MFGAFTKLFKRSEPLPAATRFTGSQPPPRTAPPLPTDGTGVMAHVPRAATGQSKGSDALIIPYASIIKAIPQELWGKLAPAGLAGHNYLIARKTVLEQLPHGAVKANFGDLRRCAPNGVFVNNSAEDTRMVDLPLSEILTQLHPDALSRRENQTRVEASPDLPDLFGVKGERLPPLRVLEKKPNAYGATFTRQKDPTSFTPNLAAPAPVQQPEVQPPPSKIFQLPQPKVAPLPAATTIRMQPSPPTAQPAATPRQATGNAPISLPKPAFPAARTLPALPSNLPRPAVAVTSPPVIPAVSAGAGSFFIALDAVASAWPDGVRQELAQLKIPEAKVALPPNEICEGLKRGRIQFPWRMLRSWIQPTPIYASPSPHDNAILELPLRTLTPLFLEFIRSNPVNRQVADAENITEFFKKAEQSSGTSAELLQPLFNPPGTDPEPSLATLQEPAVPAERFTPGTTASVLPTATAPQSTTQPTIEGDALCLPIALIANGWPEPVMHDIASFGLSGSRVEIPLSAIEPCLKKGRIEFDWLELCGWLNPPSKSAQVSINGVNRLSLPLGMIAPLFMKARGAAQVRRRTTVADDIPDLFSSAGTPLTPLQPTTSAPAAPMPSAATATQRAEAPAAAPKKVPANLSELFEEPTKKTWTPNEIVQRSTKLPKVAGTLIALQDGLLVAANMPADIKAETIAAFVPQIFGRLNQYTKELQMGDTSAVSFTVEAGTIQVYNTGIIYFAAFGRKGDLLPLAELQLIAGELSRHTK